MGFGGGFVGWLGVTGDLIKAVDMDEDTVIVGGPGGGQNTHYGELFFVNVIIVGDAVGWLEGRANIPPVDRGDSGADDGVEVVFQEVAAGSELLVGVIFHFEEFGRRSDDPEVAFHRDVTHADGDRVNDSGVRLQVFEVEVGDVFDGITEVVDCIEHELQRAAFGSDDQVVAAGVLAEDPVDNSMHDQHRDHQRDAQCHAEGSQE